VDNNTNAVSMNETDTSGSSTGRSKGTVKNAAYIVKMLGIVVLGIMALGGMCWKFLKGPYRRRIETQNQLREQRGPASEQRQDGGIRRRSTGSEDI
jgi:hypothetical protein